MGRGEIQIGMDSVMSGKRRRKKVLTNFYACTEEGWDAPPSVLKPMCVIRHDLKPPRDHDGKDSRPRCKCGSLLLPDIQQIVDDKEKCLSCNRG